MQRRIQEEEELRKKKSLPIPMLYDRPTIQRELGWARGRLRLNALRVRASPNAYAKDPHTFVRCVQTSRRSS